MDTSLFSRHGRGLNLPTVEDTSTPNADEEKVNEVIKSTFDLLERGDNEIALDDSHKDVILVLGNTGSGKSTFTQWLAGDNTKMISRETKQGIGEYIIEDHNRIGNITFKSKTVFPELVIDPKTNAAYYDCPGFSDTQGSDHDIATTYFIKKVLDHSQSVKLVFTISHPSVRKGVDRQDFMKLVRHATDLVRDVEKFKHSIAIVATKVDNQYIKQGQNFNFVDDHKVISAISDFLQVAKQYLKDDSKRADLSEKKKRFYKNAIKFVEVLLTKEGEKYTRIGLFRRPDMPGPVSDIKLLQSGKLDMERIVYEKLNFTLKNNEDFGYTVSEKTKNDINDLVEEINKKLWSRLSNIAGNIEEHYGNMVKKLRNKINLFASGANAVDVNSSEAEKIIHKFNSGYEMISEMANETKNSMDPEQLLEIIDSKMSNLDIHLTEYDISYIANQGKYFNFLQTVSDKLLSSKPWSQLFQDVKTYVSESKTNMLIDVTSAAEKINTRIQVYWKDIVKGIQEEYAEKIKVLNIQELPQKINRDGSIFSYIIEETKNETTTEKLVNSIQYVVGTLGISLPKQNLKNVANQAKYLRFLEVVGDGILNIDTTLWLSPFENMAKYFYEYEKWYLFLEDLYNKFSDYSIQIDRQKYNVANLDDWDQTWKPQGISITPNTFDKFLDKIENFKVKEYETIRNITLKADLQIEELNQMLSLTLKHRTNIMCSEPYVTVRGSYISLKEAMQNIVGNSDTNNSCGNFEDGLAAGKYKVFRFLALNKVFIDTDLSLAGKGISIAVIAPNWEVVGSRGIDLSGADGAPHAMPKAKNGAHPGNDGANGAPGNPGASGEVFFGIGSTFVGGGNLTIASNGGKGSKGQDGGDGARGLPGRDARTPSKKDPDCENGYFRDFQCSKLREDRLSFGYTETRKTYRIHGKSGSEGGNGGDGGKGGMGGDSGNIAILELSRPSGITKLASKGAEGEIGKAGTGGAGNKDGNDIIAVYTYAFLVRCLRNCLRTEWNLKETITNGVRPAGKRGIDGENTVGLQNAVPSHGINRTSDIINAFKVFLRENLNNRFEKYNLLRFLDQLNANDEVKILYDIFALIDEFQGLEEQFHKLRHRMDTSVFYRTILERITEFAIWRKDTPDSDENKKVLNYLYTAALGRLYSLKEDAESSFIIDIRGYLALVKENIKILKDLQMTNNKVDVINRHKENYKKGIDKKIEEAKSLIEKQINPDIETINSNIDNELIALIEETLTLQKQAERDYEKLEKKTEELENAVFMKGLFSFFGIIGGIVSLLGPIGSIAGTVFETTSNVVPSLTLNNQEEKSNLPSGVLLSIETIGGQIKAIKHKKVAYLNKLLDDLSEEIKKIPGKLGDMTDKIDDIKGKLKKASGKKITDFKQVSVLESELKEELKRKGEDLKIPSGDIESVNALKVIDKFTKNAHFGFLFMNINHQIKEDNEKLDAITNAVERMEDKIKNLREYEENIYDTVAPMLQEMEEEMKGIEEKLESKSQVSLDVTRWHVQRTLKDMRLQMERLTKEFEVKNDLSRSIENLEEVMTTLTNIYDRIQSYQEQKDLADYIADISSVAATSIDIKDQQLANAVNHLEFTITANLVLRQYKSAIDAFKQWVFPFADRYIEETMLPSHLELTTNMEDLIRKAIREIETMKRKLDLYHSTVEKGDQYVESGEFSRRYISSAPFFVWKNEEHRESISSLFSGKEVVMKSLVSESPSSKDAIKFRDIEFVFKAKNETAQSSLSEILKGFDMRATHLGNSYYRYGDKIFSITSDSVLISYSCEKSEEGVPIRSNEVYKKLKAGDLLLSPYTLWELRMINRTNVYSFEDLENYKNETYIELSGFGSYVDTEVSRPDTYRPLVSSNNANPLPLKYKASNLDQAIKSDYVSVRFPEEISLDGDYATNGSPKGISSPIGFLRTFLQTSIITNAMISFNKIFMGKKISARTETSNEVPNLATSKKVTDLQKIVTGFAENDSKGETTVPKPETIFSLNGCSHSFLPSDQNKGSDNHLAEIPDLNCSLLLADLAIRTITGNRYESSKHECLLSVSEVTERKINDLGVKSEPEIKRLLQCRLSEEEKMPISVFSKMKGYAKMVFQFLLLEGNDDTDKYIQDVRHLFIL